MLRVKKITDFAGRTLVVLSIMIVCSLVSTSLWAQKGMAHPSFGVQKSGSGRPMILIPGLFCSGHVWDETVAHFKDQFTCYAITLPGFAGQPPITSDSVLTVVVRQLADFIRQNKLESPIIVGHSLGGSVALQLGIMYPTIPGALVIISSAPYLPGLAMSPDITVDSAAKIGILIKNGMKNMTPAQIGQSQKYSLPMMIKDSAKIALVMDMAVHSDAYTQGEVMAELFRTDARRDIKNIQCPVLVLADWSSYKKYGATRESVMKNYTAQFGQARRVTIAINDSSYHFIMYDEPLWLQDQMDHFLAHQ